MSHGVKEKNNVGVQLKTLSVDFSEFIDTAAFKALPSTVSPLPGHSFDVRSMSVVYSLVTK